MLVMLPLLLLSPYANYKMLPLCPAHPLLVAPAALKPARLLQRPIRLIPHRRRAAHRHEAKQRRQAAILQEIPQAGLAAQQQLQRKRGVPADTVLCILAQPPIVGSDGFEAIGGLSARPFTSDELKRAVAHATLQARSS
jgi:hypothetical protein